MAFKLIITSILLLSLSACDRAPTRTPAQNPAQTRPERLDQGVSPVESEQAGTADTQSAQAPLDLTLDSSTLSYPADGAENLFAGDEDKPEYDYFQARESDASVRLKGRVFMRDEVSTQRRLENVDGGEVGLEVPLK